MKVTQALLNEYRKELDREAEKARAYFRSAIAEFYRRYPDATTEDTRVFVLDLMGSALPNFLDLTATLACDLFDELADECGFKGDHARLYETTDWQMVDRKVHYLAGFLNEGDKDKFKSEVADLTHYYCKRAAYDNMVKNCQAQKVKWARVPTGLETCAFCFMLASRGFVYQSEEKASAGDHGYHDNCDCVVIPGFQGKDGNPRVKIDGYDPETMYENWLSCARTVGINKHGDPLQGKWTEEERKAVLREVKTRDWHWLYTGEAPVVDASLIDVSQLNEDQKKAYEKELGCATIMARDGFRMRLTDNPKAKPTAGMPKLDYAIGTPGTSWEAKCPEGNGYLAVAGNIAKADAKFRRLNKRARVVLSNLDSQMSDEQFWRFFEESLDDPESDYSNIEEILFVFKSKKIRRWMQ